MRLLALTFLLISASRSCSVFGFSLHPLAATRLPFAQVRSELLPLVSSAPVSPLTVMCKPIQKDRRILPVLRVSGGGRCSADTSLPWQMSSTTEAMPPDEVHKDLSAVFPQSVKNLCWSLLRLTGTPDCSGSRRMATGSRLSVTSAGAAGLRNTSTVLPTARSFSSRRHGRARTACSRGRLWDSWPCTTQGRCAFPRSSTGAMTDVEGAISSWSIWGWAAQRTKLNSGGLWLR